MYLYLATGKFLYFYKIEIILHYVYVGCSRLHARIAFDSTGTPWLRDLESGNGTTINKEKLPPQSIGKLEANTPCAMKKAGSRGVMVYPGDVIQFGASTRLFVLNGPNYFDRGAMKARRQMMLLKQKQNSTSVNGNSNNNGNGSNEDGVSWGMDFDHHDNTAMDGSTDHESKIPLTTNEPTMKAINLDDPSTIPEKYRKLYDKLQSKKYKLQNIQTETRRIQTKAITVELTSGQQATLDRNEKQEQLLEQDIQKLYNELQMKLNRNGNPLSASSRSRQATYSHDDDEDVDDFYDRTRTLKTSKSDVDSNSAETMESLTSKWNTLVSKLESQKYFITKAQSKINEIRREINDTKGNGDDCFFLQNDLEIANDQYKKVQGDNKKFQDDLESTEKMVLIIDDKIVFDRELKFIGKQCELNELCEMKSSICSKKDADKKEIDMMPPPALPPKRKVESMDNGNHLMPPPPSMMMRNNDPEIRNLHRPVLASTLSQQASEIDNIENDRVSTANSSIAATINKRKRQGPSRPPIVSTLQALQQASSSNVKKNEPNISTHERSKKLKGTNLSEKNETYDPKVDQWVAPKEQDGSGRTKLNAKFEGRY